LLRPVGALIVFARGIRFRVLGRRSRSQNHLLCLSTAAGEKFGLAAKALFSFSPKSVAGNVRTSHMGHCYGMFVFRRCYQSGVRILALRARSEFRGFAI